MDTLKLNRILCIFFLVLFSCNTQEAKNYNAYVAGGEGFWISFKNFSKKYSEKDLKHLEIYVKNRNVKYVKEDLEDYLYANNYNIGISEKILLQDTLIINVKDEIIKIHNFSNLIEEGFDQSHRKISVCRYCTSTINNKKIEDQGNNIIIVDFDKL
jgi:hypothetical protein